MNHAVKQNEEGDAAYKKALELAQEIIPNGPIGVKMAKFAINKGSEVRNTPYKCQTILFETFIMLKLQQHHKIFFQDKSDLFLNSVRTGII